MSARLPDLAVVTLAALDLRGRPDHRAELTSQLLMGEIVRPLRRSRDRRWWEVENRSDGFRGWARDWGLVGVSRARASRWARRARARLGVLFAEVRDGPGRGALVSPLFWNARVIPGRRVGRQRQVELPDGRRGWIPGAALARAGAAPGITTRVRGLLGVPYLWGGRTPLGLDCSGFTQQVMAEQGLILARNADQQFREALPLPRGEQPALGDLVFFGTPGDPPGHVGLGLGGGYYAHCRGRVRINSTDPSNPLHDKELHPQTMGWRRPRRGPRRSPAPPLRGGESA